MDTLVKKTCWAGWSDVFKWFRGIQAAKRLNNSERITNNADNHVDCTNYNGRFGQLCCNCVAIWSIQADYSLHTPNREVHRDHRQFWDPPTIQGDPGDPCSTLRPDDARCTGFNTQSRKNMMNPNISWIKLACLSIFSLVNPHKLALVFRHSVSWINLLRKSMLSTAPQ